MLDVFRPVQVQFDSTLLVHEDPRRGRHAWKAFMTFVAVAQRVFICFRPRL